MIQSRFSPHVLFCLWLALCVALLGPFAKAIVALPAIGALCYLAYLRPQIKIPTYLLVICGGTIALMFASVLWAYDPASVPSRALKTFGVLAGGLLTLLACREIPDHYLPKLGTYLVSAGIFVAAYLLIERFFDYPFYRTLRHGQDLSFNLWPSFQNKTIGALTLLAPALLAWPISKYLRGIFTALMLTFLSISINQTSQMAVVVGLLAFFIPIWQPKTGKIFIVGVIALILTAPLIGLQLFAPLAEIGQTSAWLRESSASMRLEIWHFISLKILESPLLGYGLEATRIMTFDSQKLYFATNTVMHPHNGALQIWIEFGALGAILAAVSVYFIWSEIAKNPSLIARRLYNVGFAMCFFVSLIAWGLWQGWFVGLVFLMCALLQLSVRTRHKCLQQ